MPAAIKIIDRAAVRELVLDRAEVHNAFDDRLVAELTAALQEANRDERVRVVVLTAAGGSFSAGADLNWMRSMAEASEAGNRDDALRLAALMRHLQYLQKPTIARVNGAAYGGGVGLIACCDMAIGVDTASFGLTEVKLGLVPAVISPYVIRAIGLRQARRWFLTGERFDAATALHIGLLHQVVPAEQLDQAVEHSVNLLLKAAPVAQQQAKRLVWRCAGAELASAEIEDRENAALIARLRVSAEGQEGLSAFLDKRRPSWLAGD